MTNTIYFNDDGLVKQTSHPDIYLLAGDNDQEEPIPAHKCILELKSDELKMMIYDDDYYNDDSVITLYGMNHEELKVFIEYLYVGDSIDSDKIKMHARSLFCAADSYNIPLLRDRCRRELMTSLNASNALDIFELTKDYPRDRILHNMARSYVVCHKKVIAFSDEFGLFVERNPKLTVELIKDVTLKGIDPKKHV